LGGQAMTPGFDTGVLNVLGQLRKHKHLIKGRWRKRFEFLDGIIIVGRFGLKRDDKLSVEFLPDGIKKGRSISRGL
jgi:hypothetical protein